MIDKTNFYAFPGLEPNVYLACDKLACEDNVNFDNTMRLTCGHSFHKGCIITNRQQTSTDHSYVRTEEVKCSICYPLLAQRMEELAQSLNR